MTRAALCLALLGLPAQAATFEGPYGQGETIAEVPATCDTAADWLDRAPDYDGRVTYAIAGEITERYEDEVLVYLVMCDPEGVQVMCVTYRPSEHRPGDARMFAGGYNRVDERKVMLDPCIAYPIPGE